MSRSRQSRPNHTGIKIRFLCWAIMLLLVLIYFAKIFSAGSLLNTNVMNLLPHTKQDPITTQAIDAFSNTMGKQLIFLIGNPNQQRAQQAADVFFNQIKQSSLFQSIHYRVTTNEQTAWGSFYFPYRLSLLTEQQKELLQNNRIQQIQNAALSNLYSPFGLANSALLKTDPYFLFQHFVMALPNPASHLTLHNQRMTASYKDHWYIMITANLKADSFSLENQKKVTSLIKISQQNVLQQFPHTEFLQSGMLFYAKAGTNAAQRDISTIGIGSLIGIVLLMLLTFRSLYPLLLTCISGTIGFMVAFAITHLIFGSVYLFTLAFGASLIGISVDYAFFYYADQLLGGSKWHPIQGLKNIFSGITLGLINIILAYVILSFTPFPGLHQLAIFATTGLTAAYLTVVCLFPIILKTRKCTFTPPLLHLTNCYLNIWKKISSRKVFILYCVIFIVSAIGIHQLKPNDDIHLLESMPAQLTHNDQLIKQIIGTKMGINFFVIEGKTPRQTLEHEAILAKKIHHAFPKISNHYLSVYSYLPSIAEQKQNFDLVKTNLVHHTLMPYLEKIGIKTQQAKAIQKNLSAISFQPLTIKNWLASPVSKSLRFLWLGNIHNQTVTVMLLSDKLTSSQLQTIANSLPFATYVNKAAEVSHIFKVYRERISLLLSIIYLVLVALLTVRYGLKKAFYYILPPFSASALSIAVLGWLHIPLTLFNVLALVLVLGISVDYVLFFAETRSTYQSTMLAITLSAIATALSFGLLAFSQTPVIHDFGITVLTGIISALVLSPFVIRTKQDHL